VIGRTWSSWLALVVGVAVAIYAVIAQDPPEAEPINAPSQVFSAGRAMKHVEAIAREPHPMGSEQIGEVREIILEALRGLRLEPQVQAPRDANRPERNILARLKGKGPPTKKAILLCAHYDSVRTGPGAGDNASGVAAVLETLRALKAVPALDRDVIALIDDGEEQGLRGASLFVDEHPWAHEIGVVLNIDARGNHGPSIMFETSAKNGWLIRQLAEASLHPLATSMSMDIYRIMPNDTNLSVFKRAGLDGLNFAFSRGIAYYHSPDDTPANLDPRTLQHQGENVLALAKHFGRLDLEDVRSEDEIYFSVLNRAVLHYPASWAEPSSLIPAVLWLLAVVLGYGRGRVKLPDLLVGISSWPVALIASVFAVGGFWLVLRDILGSLGVPAIKIDMAILAACAAVATMVTLAIERRAAKGRSLEAISLGALAWLAVLTVASARFLPGMSYMFTWPAAFSLLGLSQALMMRRSSAWASEAIFLGSIPALVILPPLARESFEGLSLRFPALLMILVVLFLGAILPLLGPIVSPRRAN
jgi:hypothetical protein